MSPSKRPKKKKDAPIHPSRAFVAEVNEEALFLDPPETYDEAIIGRTSGSFPVAIYDYQLLIERLIDVEELSEEDAIDHIEYNILGSIGYENFPVVMNRLPPADDDSQD